jgi:hypothetical protein
MFLPDVPDIPPQNSHPSFQDDQLNQRWWFVHNLGSTIRHGAASGCTAQARLLQTQMSFSSLPPHCSRRLNIDILPIRFQVLPFFIHELNDFTTLACQLKVPEILTLSQHEQPLVPSRALESPLRRSKCSLSDARCSCGYLEVRLSLQNQWFSTDFKSILGCTILNFNLMIRNLRRVFWLRI